MLKDNGNEIQSMRGIRRVLNMVEFDVGEKVKLGRLRWQDVNDEEEQVE